MADVESTTESLHRTAIHLLRRVRGSDVDTGLTPARLSALSVLVFGGPQSLGGLASIEQVTPPTMSNLISGLAGDGYVRRVPSTDDRRKIEIHATAKGRRLMLRARDARLATLAQLFGALSECELNTLSRAAELLQRVLRA